MKFNVTLKFVNNAGNRTQWTGVVEHVPGEDIFKAAAREHALRVKMAKKGKGFQIARMLNGRSVAVRMDDTAPLAKAA
jgi:hypothetical protein